MSLRFPWVPGVLLLALVSTGWAGSGSYNREIRYPTRFEFRPGPNGVAVVPSDFVTRETGSMLKAERVGIARNVMVDGLPGVRLRLQDGRTLITRTGRLIKLDGKVYRTAGWREGQYLLISQGGPRRTLAFALPKP